MEMGLIIVNFVISALSAICSVASLILLLAMALREEEEETPSVTADAVPPPSGREAKDDVEKRRREAVNARQHSNFMNYDGTPQQHIDPNTILADGG